MNIHVITLFPEMIEQVCDFGVLGRAIRQGLVTVTCSNPRDYTTDKHRTVDDRPYGGGPGMLMKVEPLAEAIKEARQQASEDVKVVYLSPQGKVLKQDCVKQLSAHEDVILLAGRYEGVDQRIIDQYVDEELSIGDYVVSGGELPALILIDAVARMIPGVLGDEDSAQQDSFMKGILDTPHYTRPEEFEGRRVPDVLLGGDHKAIASWRMKQALGKTWRQRPDLLAAVKLDEEQKHLLAEFQREQGGVED